MTALSSSKYRAPWSILTLLGLTIFFVWHTFAVGISAIPITVNDPLFSALRIHFRPVVMPYINTLAQWQEWRVFVSPDPLKLAERFSVDLLREGKVVYSEFLSQQQLYDMSRNASAAIPMAQRICGMQGEHAGDEIRLTKRLYPTNRMSPTMEAGILDSPDGAMNDEIEWYEYMHGLASCDSLSL